MVISQFKCYGMIGYDFFYWSRVVIEKFFGYDLESVCDFDEIISSVFSLELVFCIDYYLGKEIVQNIMVFWFVNQIFELIWNNYYVLYVQIIMVEDIGIVGWVGYYDGIGVVCDVIQNYLL